MENYWATISYWGSQLKWSRFKSCAVESRRLSLIRRFVAEMAQLVEVELAQLGMPHCRFKAPVLNALGLQIQLRCNWKVFEAMAWIVLNI